MLHPAIDGCLQLLKEQSISYADVAEVSLRVNFLVLEVTGKRHPKVGVDGKFSIYHCVAVALIDGQVTEKQFTEQRVHDSTVIGLSDHVTATVDSGVAADEVYIEFTLNDGRKFHKHVEHALGSLKRPLSDSQLEDKFHELAAGFMPRLQIANLVRTCWRFAELDDVSDVARKAAVEDKRKKQ